jgi:hypothetical protein
MKVYELSHHEATAKIEARITVLRAWINYGIPWKMSDNGSLLRDEGGEQIPEYIPKSFTEFVEWNSSSHSKLVANTTYSHAGKSARISDFGKLSRTTLNQKYNILLKDSAQKAMASAAEILLKQLELSNKTSIISSKDAEILYLKLVINAQEKELKNSRINERTAITEKRQEHELRLRNEAELQRLVSELELKIVELTKIISQIRPLKQMKI